MPPLSKIDLRTPPSLVPAAPVWALVLNNQLTVPPAYDESRVYFSIEGDRIVAYDLVSGVQAWIVSAQPLMEPVAGDGLLFFIEPGVLTALHSADGSIAWRVPFTEKLVVRPVWDNGWLIMASERGEIGAVRASDGKLIWRRDITSPAHAAPALASDRVYVPTSDGRIVALLVETGAPVWERRLGGTPNEVLALDERLYVGAKDNYFYCLTTKDGRVDWKWRTGGDVVGLPIVDEQRVYFVALDNILRALDLNSGVQHWMRPLPIRPTWGPVRAGSTIVVAGQASALHAFNIKDGAVTGTITPGLPPATTAPTVTGLGNKGFGTTVAPNAAVREGTVPATAAPVTTPPPVEEQPAAPAPASAPSTTGPGSEKPAPAAPLKTPEATITSDSEAAAPPHVFPDRSTRLSMLLMITRDIARGAAATLMTRSFEPAIAPLVPLPNLVMLAPTPQPSK
jgi:outer membrane protein assembly factor BamB